MSQAATAKLPSRRPTVRRRFGGRRGVVQAAQSGDREAVEELVREHWPRAHATALGILGEHAAASDVAQESLLRAVEHLADFDSEREFAPWLAQITTNRALDWLRSEGRQPTLRTDLGVQAPSLDQTELIEAVEALQTLEPETRAMVVLRHLGGYSSAEIAEFLGRKPGTVRSSISRGLQLIADQASPKDKKERDRSEAE